MEIEVISPAIKIGVKVILLHLNWQSSHLYNQDKNKYMHQPKGLWVTFLGHSGKCPAELRMVMSGVFRCHFGGRPVLILATGDIQHLQVMFSYYLHATRH